MKKLAFAFLALACACTGNQGGQKDLTKVLAIQTVVSEADVADMSNVEKRLINVPYISKADTIAVRPMHIFIPKDAPQPLPVVFVPHYPIDEKSGELHRYLKKGWAAASPVGDMSIPNGYLSDDDLVFNNACLYVVRHTPEIDPTKIMLYGGSAGGYMSMMLSALQMGICGSIANAPIQNLYFCIHQHFRNAWNVHQEDPSKFPILCGIYKMFIPIVDNFPDLDDVARWEALSPVGLGECYSNPITIVHYTSDVLVPVDQTSKKYTYDTYGEGFPEGFSTRLDPSLPGKLGHSLEEELPAELTCNTRMSLVPVGTVAQMPFDKEKPFNIVIHDDGVVEHAGDHTKGVPEGFTDMLPFFEYVESQGLAQTEMLRPGKLVLLLDRYAGNSVQLPAHEGIDDTAYGSLEIYRQEVVEELGRYASLHSLAELDAAVVAAIADRKDLKTVWKEIKKQL